jgi:hypothetical protein
MDFSYDTSWHLSSVASMVIGMKMHTWPVGWDRATRRDIKLGTNYVILQAGRAGGEEKALSSVLLKSSAIEDDGWLMEIDPSRRCPKSLTSVT